MRDIQGQARVPGFQAHSWTEVPAVRRDHPDLRVPIVGGSTLESVFVPLVRVLLVAVRAI